MKPFDSVDTRSHSENIFGLSVTHAYWQQPDFWLACIAAILFWLSYTFLNFHSLGSIIFPPVGITLFFLIFIFPILEEIVFRGLIQESLQQLFANNHIRTLLIWPISSANVLTSLLFSSSHLWAHSILWALATLIPSLIFGYFKDKYQSLQPSIMLHIFYNLGFYLIFMAV